MRKPGASAANNPGPGFPISVELLQPCPFCGSSEVWISGNLEPKFVACRTCWAFGPSASTVTRAAERWNDRASPPETKTVAATSK
ncbi:Lar family restriction alleviation protein [Bradyrhizobium sacchari]|uniref:Lar family restriction alleviation protein n=1 Tax=Bradyrhizobium sacchari TaxID=1399419 RepID=A0A560HTV5_9BRAD|nr:Lar family restriction alleviation protein [Bradyrhizobium sacchari]TWB68201.1 Lar family restriction alleviation protein [Bradyrhizobium sacchari]